MSIEMIGNLGFSQEEDDVVSAPIGHYNSLRPFIPEIISDGGAILSLLQEEHDDQALMFSFIVADDNDVDTTLKLSTAVSTYSTAPNLVVDDDEELDTTLSLFSIFSRDFSPIYDPMPLRCFHPQQQVLNEDSFTSLSLSPPTHKIGAATAAAGKRKRGDNGKKKRGKRSNNAGDEDRVGPSIEEFPALVQALESCNETRPVFLYRKKLEGSDVGAHHNRLFVTRREPLMEFLTAEAAATVDGSNEGLMILGLDEGGKAYNLGLKKWRSLNMTVINSDWNKMVATNNAGRGDVVNIWGFRQNGKLGLAIIFRG